MIRVARGNSLSFEDRGSEGSGEDVVVPVVVVDGEVVGVTVGEVDPNLPPPSAVFSSKDLDKSSLSCLSV